MRDERGSVLIAVILVSLVLTGLVALGLASATQGDRSSTRDKNFDVALAVAESGAEEAVAKLQATQGSYRGTFLGQAANGPYSVDVSGGPSGIVVESRGTSGSTELGRTRVVRLTLQSPSTFTFALLSTTSVSLKNVGSVTGDVWANDSVTVSQGTSVSGKVTAAQGWLELEQNASVGGDVQTGGYSPSNWAIKLENGAQIGGSAKASVTTPGCTDEPHDAYTVSLGEGSSIARDVTTWGSHSGPGTIGGTYTQTCTAAPATLELPPYAYNPSNYDAATRHEFSSVSAFMTWLASNKTNLHGTFYVADSSPSQDNRIDLTGAVVTGDTTIVTNAPVFTNGVTDTPSGSRTFVIASSYRAPTGTSCSVNHDSSECAVHVKNNFSFSTSCATASLIYANNGPVAVKNGATQCGAIYAESILVKNGQTLVYDARVARAPGFGDSTYVISRWEERTAS